MHLDRHVLDVQDDVGHVFAHAGDGREFMQHAVDMDGGDGRALQRGQQDAAQRIAERQAEAALQRLRHHGRDALGIFAGHDLQLVRLDQFLPVFLNHLDLFHRRRAYRSVDHGCRRRSLGKRARGLRRSLSARIAACRSRRAANDRRRNSDATTLARAAAVMRDRRHVADRGDGEARRLQGAQRRFTAGAGTGDFDFHACACRARSPCGRRLRRPSARRRGSTCANP